jgi:hypothetical protein
MLERRQEGRELTKKVEKLDKTPMPNTLPGMDVTIKFLNFLRYITNGSGVLKVPFTNVAVVYGVQALNDLAKAETKYYKNKDSEVSDEFTPIVEKSLSRLIKVFGGDDGVMGNKEISDEYKPILREFINSSFNPKRLRREIPKAFNQWLTEEVIDTRMTQNYFAQVSLSRLFPFIDWTKENIDWAVGIVEGASPAATTAFVDDLMSSPQIEGNYLEEKANAKGANEAFTDLGKLLYKEYLTALQSGDNEFVLAAKESFFFAFAKKFALDENAELNKSEVENIDGVLTVEQLADVSANIISVVSASYGTVATGLGGILRALALEPDLQKEVRAIFESIRDTDGNLIPRYQDKLQGTVVETILYRALAQETPLPALARYTESELDLNGSILEAGTRIIGLLRAPMLDKTLFPEVKSFGEPLTDEQIGITRLVWGLIEIAAKDLTAPRHCAGFASSINMILMTLNEILKDSEELSMEKDSSLSSTGSTASRKKQEIRKKKAA